MKLGQIWPLDHTVGSLLIYRALWSLGLHCEEKKTEKREDSYMKYKVDKEVGLYSTFPELQYLMLEFFPSQVVLEWNEQNPIVTIVLYHIDSPILPTI